MRMILTPGSRVQSSEMPWSRAQRQTLTQTPAQTLTKGREEDIAAEEAHAAETGRTYLRWDSGNCLAWHRITRSGFGGTVEGRLSWDEHPHRVTYLPGPTHARRIVCGVVRTYQNLFQDAFAAENNWVEEECQAVIDVGGTKPPPINEEELWTRIAGGRKRGRIYGMGVVPSHSYPLLFGTPDDDDTATVTLINREISQQAEAHAQRVAVVETITEENVRTLETTVQSQSQSQEVSELRKAYSEMYSFLTQMQSIASSSKTMPPSLPLPPPPAQSRSPPP
ncbi:hypothetical protein PIB30_039428 [Stylosanthes scabra]|uniref:Uncharacterized protein n=1 Tax=Stylosanthes scabra TaxID=79078 RepID=A0ABU6SE57_9FABA|nr:hypothetical protein [Stylosanthes scabra]